MRTHKHEVVAKLTYDDAQQNYYTTLSLERKITFPRAPPPILPLSFSRLSFLSFDPPLLPLSFSRLSARARSVALFLFSSTLFLSPSLHLSLSLSRCLALSGGRAWVGFGRTGV